MVLSAADHWTLTDDTKHTTGFWAEELVVPYETFADAGWADRLAAVLASPANLADVDPDSFDLVFHPTPLPRSSPPRRPTARPPSPATR
jgi:hypothetical protein